MKLTSETTSLSRFYGDIDQAIAEGSKRFYLFGSNIKDEVFYNGQGQVLDLVESLAFQLLRSVPARCAKVIVLRGDHALLCEKLNGPELMRVSYSDKVSEVGSFLIESVGQVMDDLDGLTSAASVETDSTQNSQMESGDGVNFTISVLNGLAQGAKEVSGSFAIVFDRFDWEAKLFEKQQHDFDLVKRATWFGADEKFEFSPFCFYIVDSLDGISGYLSIDDSSKECVYIGQPPQPEIHLALVDYFREPSEAIGLRLKRIASIAGNSRLGLKTTANICDQIFKTHPESADEFVNQFKEAANYFVDDLKWSDIYLPVTKKKEVQDICDRYRASFEGDAKSSKLGMILFGPSGTGKTMLAKVIANQEGFTLISSKLADLKGKFVGHTAHAVKDLFNQVRAAQPCILFLDELESIFPARSGSDSDSFTRDLVTQFLAESDGLLSNNEGIFILGATNYINLVDSAIASRLTPVEVPLPDAEARSSILASFIADDWSAISIDNKKSVISRTAGCSGRDLKNIVYDSFQAKLSSGSSLDEALEHASNALQRNVAEQLHSNNHGFRVRAPSGGLDGFSSIIGYQKIKNKLSTINNTIQPDLLRGFNLEPQNGFLLHGPPGNGKTFFAECVASEYALDIIEIRTRDLFSQGGNVVANLNELVDQVLRYSVLVENGVLLFFDEFDAIAGEQAYSLRESLLKRITDIRSSQYRVVLFAATNHYQAIDDAIKRPGRFDVHLYVGNPQLEKYPEFIRSFIAKYPKFRLPESISNEELSRKAELAVSDRSSNYSVSNLKMIAINAMTCSLSRYEGAAGGTHKLDIDDFDFEV